MRLLHLYRPHLLLDLARQRRLSGSWPEGPIILGGQPWIAGTVLDANQAARALGVRRGLPLGSAHRLAPEATFLDPDPEADRAAIEAAFEALAAFSPAIAGSVDPGDQAFGLLEAQVDGLEAPLGTRGADRCPGFRRAEGSPCRRAPGGDRGDAVRGHDRGRSREAG